MSESLAIDKNSTSSLLICFSLYNVLVISAMQHIYMSTLYSSIFYVHFVTYKSVNAKLFALPMDNTVTLLHSYY